MGTARWFHTDPRGVTVAAQQAIARARFGTWKDDDESRADYRALLITGFGSCANLGSKPIMLSGEKSNHLLIAPSAPATERTDNLRIQSMLGLALLALIAGEGKGDPRKFFPGVQGTVDLETNGGAPGAEKTVDTAIFGVDDVALAIVAVIVVGVGLIANGIAWMGQNEVQQNAITTNVKSQNLAAAIAESHQIIDEHHRRQEAKGVSLAWDEGELRMLETLSASIRELSGWTPPDLKSVPDVAGVTKATGAAIASTGEAIKGVGDGIKAVGQGVGKGVENAGSVLPFLAALWAIHEFA